MSARRAPKFNRIAVPWSALGFTLLTALLFGVALTGCGPNIEAQLTEIRALQDAGQFEPSIAPLRKLISQQSDEPEANYRLGIALLQTGRSSLAVWPLRKASESREFGVQAGLLLASTLLGSEAYEESIRASNRVLEREPDNVAALYGRGVAELSAGQPEDALVSADTILTMNPEHHSASLLRGSALVDLDRSDEAEETLVGLAERAAKKQDLNDAARKCAALAVFYRTQESNAKATTQFDQCLSQYPTHKPLRQQAAEFYVAIENIEGALDTWRSAVEATPEDLGLRSNLASMLLDYGRESEALELAKETVELFDTPNAWQMLSDLQRRSKNPTAARKALEEAIERSRSASPAVQFMLADMLIDEGLYDRAETIAASLEEPSYRHLLRGAILLRQDEPGAALTELDAGLRLYPNNAGARYLAGNAALALGDRVRALGEFREATRVGETETDAALRLAELHFQQGEYRKAFRFADRHIRKRPFAETTPYVIAARSQAALGEYQAAESLLDVLRQKNPADATAYLEFAAIKLKTDGPEQALEVLLEADLDLSAPENEQALRFVVVTFLQAEKVAEAGATVQKALSSEPERAVLLELKGRVLLHAGKRIEAEKFFDAALAAEVEFAPALEAKGSLFLAAGDFEGAFKLFDRAWRKVPGNANYLYQAGQAKLLQRDSSSALTLFEQVLEIDPVHVGANNDSAWMMASQGLDLPEALIRTRRAVTADRNADTLDTLGYVLLAMNDSPQATSALAEALSLRPDAPSIQFRLGMALAAEGKREQAAEMFEKALEKNDFPELNDARTELSKLRES